MNSDKNRRNFIKKTFTGISSILALPLLSLAQSKKTMEKEQKNILQIKPLGFQWETLDPFLFCVHHEDFYPKGNKNLGPQESLKGRHIGQDFIVKDGWRMYHGDKIPGFPGHPHRGFETITVVRKGIVDHADSLGASGRYGDGDVQWMTAGKGIQHSEMFPLLNQEKDNPLELFQIWLNLPRKSKMVEPHFKMIWKNQVPIINQKDDQERNIRIEVLVGELEEQASPTAPPDSWANDEVNNVGIFNVEMEKGAEYVLNAIDEACNRTVYFYEGDEMTIAHQSIPTYHSVQVRPNTKLEIKNTGDSSIKILVLQGRPINEPVVQHGPFVMNTREEIQEAFEEYHNTQFGGWPWAERGPVHDRSKGRFAKHADGRIETKS